MMGILLTHVFPKKNFHYTSFNTNKEPKISTNLGDNALSVAYLHD